MTIAESTAYLVLPALPRLRRSRQVAIMVYLGQRLSPVRLGAILDTLVWQGRLDADYAQQFATQLDAFSTRDGQWRT
jgi:hypothetical protein